MGETNIRIQHAEGMLVTVFGIPDLQQEGVNVVPYMTASGRKYENDYRRQSGVKPIQLPSPTFTELTVNGSIATGRGELNGKLFELTETGIRFLDKEEAFIKPQPYANAEEKKAAEAAEEQTVEKVEIPIPHSPTQEEMIVNTSIAQQETPDDCEDFIEDVPQTEPMASDTLDEVETVEIGEDPSHIEGVIMHVEVLPPTHHAQIESAVKMFDQLSEDIKEDIESGELAAQNMLRAFAEAEVSSEDVNEGFEDDEHPVAIELTREDSIGDSPVKPVRTKEEVMSELRNKEEVDKSKEFANVGVSLMSHRMSQIKTPTIESEYVEEPEIMRRKSLKEFKPKMTMGIRHTSEDQLTRTVIGEPQKNIGATFYGAMPEPHVPQLRQQPIISRGNRRFPKLQQNQEAVEQRNRNNSVVQPEVTTTAQIPKTFAEREEALQKQLQFAASQEPPRFQFRQNEAKKAEPTLKRSEPGPLTVSTDEEQAKRDFESYQKRVVSEAVSREEKASDEIKPAKETSVSKSNIMDKLPSDVAAVIEDIPTALLGNIEEFSLTPIDIEDVKDCGESYCIDKRWKSARRWYAIDDVSSASRVLFNSQTREVYKLSVNLCKEYLRQR